MTKLLGEPRDFAIILILLLPIPAVIASILAIVMTVLVRNDKSLYVLTALLILILTSMLTSGAGLSLDAISLALYGLTSIALSARWFFYLRPKG